jgi:hypothetical protein
MERTFSPAPMGRLSRLQPLSHSFSSIQSLDGPQEQDSFGGSTVSGNSGSEEASGIDGHIQYFSLSLSHTHAHTELLLSIMMLYLVVLFMGTYCSAA